MFDRCDDVMRLNADRQSRAHFTQMERILAVGFLRAAPCGMAEQVETDRSRQRATLRAGLDTDDFADTRFKVWVKTCPARHRTREAGRISPRNAARPVRKIQRRNPQTLYPAASTIWPRAPNTIIFEIVCEKAFS